MSTLKRNKSTAKSVTGILLIAVLLTVACPVSVYAAEDNPESSVLEAFPTAIDSLDTMEQNLGTISTLYSGGTVKDNKGHISSSRGTVNENHGSIEELTAGHVGTNYGTIKSINNTGSLGVNDKAGTIGSVGMGNVVSRNDGAIQVNAGNVSDNYGTISDNCGTVVMRDGRIGNNYQNGTVTFEAKVSDGVTIPAKGTIDTNKNRVIIHSGTVTISENTGNIEIDNATVTVDINSGNISVGNNGKLICNENRSSGVITKSSESAVITCSSNNGLIYDATAVWYKIVFAGDDGSAVIEACDLVKDGVYYTQAGSNVFFTLPPEYKCDAASKVTSVENAWVLQADPVVGDTDFTIICQKYSTCDLHGHKFSDYISNNDATCTADGTKTAVCANGCGATDTIADTGSAKGHTYGEWVTTKEATETETGTRERTCAVCKDKDTDVIPVLPHTHKGILQTGTKPTCTVAGVKDRYTCSCGKTFADVTCNTEITDLAVWMAKGGSGYIAPTGHRFTTYTSNNDATCAADGTRTAVCANGCGATDTIADTGSAKGHTYGEWVTTKEATETETGTRERTCAVCKDKDTDVIPVLPHTHKGILQNGTKPTCTDAGVKDRYTCSCGKTFADVTCNTEITDLAVWMAKGGSGYIAPTGHRFNTYTSNNDATCTADGTKTAVCANGCGAIDTIADTGSAKGHTYGEWVTTKKPTLTENGTKERTCSGCGDKHTESIPALTPPTYRFIYGANSKWTKGDLNGLVFTSDAPFDKFDSVKLDGSTLKKVYYSAESGSTRITIFPVYLETLGIGEHSIEIISIDGSVSAHFAIMAPLPINPPVPPEDPPVPPEDPPVPPEDPPVPPEDPPVPPVDPPVPPTGDNSYMFWWIALLFISGGVLAGLIGVGKKRMNDSSI